MMRSAEKTSAPVSDGPLELKAPRRRAMGSVIGHTGFNVARYHTTHVFGGLFPLLAGMLIFGWRALLSVLIVVLTTLGAGLIWRRIGARGYPLRPAQLLWLGMVVALMLPATLITTSHAAPPWPILPAAGLMIAMLCWLLGAGGGGRFHPAVVVYLLLAGFYTPQFSPHTVLFRNRLFVGDVLAAAPTVPTRVAPAAWKSRLSQTRADAIGCTSPSQALGDFTILGRPGNPRSLDALLRDRVPPLEDLVLGAQPGGIGVTSAVAVIIGGLFLLYRGLIDFRIPLLIAASAWVALLVLPIPEKSQWQWFTGHTPGTGWAMGVTLANYELLASPLLFTAFFLAGSPTVRPLSKAARTVYAILVGVLSAAFQLYASVRMGSYLALMIVGLFTPVLDRMLMSRPLLPMQAAELLQSPVVRRSTGQTA